MGLGWKSIKFSVKVFSSLITPEASDFDEGLGGGIKVADVDLYKKNREIKRN